MVRIAKRKKFEPLYLRTALKRFNIDTDLCSECDFCSVKVFLSEYNFYEKKLCLYVTYPFGCLQARRPRNFELEWVREVEEYCLLTYDNKFLVLPRKGEIVEVGGGCRVEPLDEELK